jgi:hypothetical protein
MAARLLSIIAAIACLSAYASADYAVIVGIQKYKNLPIDASLAGCVNDAEDMAMALRNAGFKGKIEVLEDEKATKTAILMAIRAGKTCKPADRFVFYFAGHGRQQPAVGLLPYDADKADSYDLKPDQLKAELDKIPSARKTVILDSCFSGAFQGGGRGASTATARTWPPVSGDRGTFIGPPRANNLDRMALGDKQTCYLTATTGYEAAIEQNFEDGKVHGVFTHELVDQLKILKGGIEQHPWKSLVVNLRSEVMQRLQPEGAQQTPLLTTAFQKVVVFGGPTDVAPDPPPDPRILSFFLASNATKRLLNLTVAPDKGEFQIGEHLSLAAVAGQSGFLVVLDYDGKVIKRVFPKGSEPLERIPPESIYGGFPDSGAIEHVKAFLMPSFEQAKSLMDAVPYGDASALDLKTARNLQADVSADNVLTAEIEFIVNNKLIGGKGVKDAAKLAVRLMKAEDPLAKALAETKRFKFAPGRDPEGSVLEGLNRLIGRREELMLAIDVVALGIKLRPETKALLEKTDRSDDDWLVLNRMLIEDALPEYCEPVPPPKVN